MSTYVVYWTENEQVSGSLQQRFTMIEAANHAAKAWLVSTASERPYVEPDPDGRRRDPGARPDGAVRPREGRRGREGPRGNREGVKGARRGARRTYLPGPGCTGFVTVMSSGRNFVS